MEVLIGIAVGVIATLLVQHFKAKLIADGLAAEAAVKAEVSKKP